MNRQSKIILITAMAVVLIGTTAFVVHRRRLKKRLEEEQAHNLALANAAENTVSTTVIDSVPTQPTVAPSVPSSPTVTSAPSTPSVSVPQQLNTVAKVQRFQDWLDVNYPTWLNGGRLNKKSGYGKFGSATQRAWKLYGSKYVSAPANPNFSITEPNAPQQAIPANIQLVLNRLSQFISASNLVKDISGRICVDMPMSDYRYMFRFRSDNTFELKDNGIVVAAGKYENAGHVLKPTYGYKLGQTISTNNFWDSVKKLVSP